MHKLAAPLFALSLSMLSLVAADRAYANASDCNLVQDHDLRAMCRARTGGTESDCNLIDNSDDRAYCRARFRR